MGKRLQSLFVALFLILWTVPALATFTPISDPNSVYLGQTNYIDFSAVSDNTTLSSISGGILQVNFSSSMYKLTFPNTWETWSMSPSIPVLRSDDPVNLPPSYIQSIAMTFSTPVSIFGFEAEPDMFLIFPMTASFFNGNTILGTITQNVNGLGGAALFAASSTDPITSVKFTINSIQDNGQTLFSPFAVAAFCYSVPEPATMLLLGSGLIGLIGFRRKFRA